MRGKNSGVSAKLSVEKGLSSAESSSPTPSIVSGPAPGAADSPAENDSLNREHYVDALAGLISHPRTEVPLTIGVYGGWGSGKSSMLRQLRSRLEGRQHQVVELNPWRIGKQEAIWLAVIEKVSSALDRQLSFSDRVRLLLRSKKVGQQISLISGLQARVSASAKKMHNWLLAAVTGAGFFSLSAEKLGKLTAEKFSEQEGVKNIARWLDRWIPDVLPFTGDDICSLFHPSLAIPILMVVVAGVALFKFWRILASPLSTQLEAYRRKDSKGESQLQRLGYEELEAVRTILRSSAEKVDKKVHRPIVIFIDDLDRCAPDRLVEVLESVHLCLADLPFVSVLAVDSSYVAKAVAHHYKFMVGKNANDLEKEEYGLLFLQKIVNIPFQLPPPESLDKYLESLVRSNLQHAEGGQANDSNIDPEAWRPILRAGEQLARSKRRWFLALSCRLSLIMKPRFLRYDSSRFNEKEWKQLLLSLKAQLSVPFDADDQEFFKSLTLTSRATIQSLRDIDDTLFRSGALKRARMDYLERANMEISEDDRENLELYTTDLQGNPRSIKRFFNIYRLAKSINSQLESQGPSRMSDLTGWLVAYQNWPRWTSLLSRKMTEYPSYLAELLNASREEWPSDMCEFLNKHQSTLESAIQVPAGMQITRCFSFLAEEVELEEEEKLSQENSQPECEIFEEA